MPRRSAMDGKLKSRLRWSWIGSLVLLVGWGCSTPPEAVPVSLPVSMAGSRRRKPAPTSSPATQPATRPAAPTSQPTTGLDALTKPYRLTPRNIVLLVYELSPLVRASREEMVAARHGLEEFRLDLSRFEPFARVNADSSRFPERQDAEGLTGEVVGGVEKETFEGAIIRLEGGASVSRFQFGDVEEEEDEVDEGSGALIRARLEVPFIGSRKRQQRVISQAFQESSARKAQLDYLSNFQAYVSAALSYYHSSVLYLDYVRAYDRKLEELEALLKEPHVQPEDVSRIEANISQSKVLRDQYDAYYRQYLLYLLAALGISPDEEYVLEEVPYQPSRYALQSRTPEGRQQMVNDAYRNNPTFRVLKDAIRDAELQRSQAILGKYDLTAFVEGTQFPFGAETYDDRVGGWQIGGGLTVRLNDQRVLTASRLKAEAQIRQFKAQIEAERLTIQQRVVTETDRLRSNEDLRPQILELIEQRSNDFKDRASRYLKGAEPALTIDDVLYPLNQWNSDNIRLASNRSYRGQSVAALMATTGEVYRIVGMQVDNGDDEIFADRDLAADE